MDRNKPFMMKDYLFASFLCLGLVACAPPKIADQASGDGSKISGISPSSVRMLWEPLKTAEKYSIFNLNSGTTPIYSTTFPQATVGALNPDTDYTLSVRGVRGTNQLLSDPLDTYSLRTWPLFENILIQANLTPDSSVNVFWAYSPWNSGLKIDTDTALSTDIECSLAEVDAGTNPNMVNPFAPASGITPLKITGLLFDEKLRIQAGEIDARKTYAAQCKAKFIDKTESLSTSKFLVSPSHNVTACPTTAVIGTNTYACNPNIIRASNLVDPLGSYRLTLMPSIGACNWVSLNAGRTEIMGSPTAAAIGTPCTISYIYELLATGYTSPRITTQVTVNAPEQFSVFPSFAVRAMSGALGYPQIKYALTSGSPVYNTHARVKGDLITDFGAGNSSFFAGAADPFHELGSGGKLIGSTSFYGFPIAPISGGSRPNGYSLDAVRAQPASEGGTTVNEGFIRGNMVVPSVQITDASFLSKAGYSAGASLSLSTFLNGSYTYDSGVNFTPVPLTHYLRTSIDFPTGGSSSPSPALWSGTLFEKSSVVIKAPTAAQLRALTPPSPGLGTINDIANADPTKTVTGLTKVNRNDFDFYAANCPAPADISDPVSAYATPTECASVPARISCYGDVIVQLPLRLVDAVIETDQRGCRIYSTETVFIQGTIRAQTAGLGPQPMPLQISSARAVIVGFSRESLGVNSVGGRPNAGNGLINTAVADGSTNPFLTSARDAPGAAAAELNLIARDAHIINLNSNDAGNAYAASNRDLDYLALNGPYVFNNYSGMFKGAIAAEVAIFPILNFTADERFKGVEPFPLFKDANALLKVSP